MFFPESGREKLPHISVPDWKGNGDFGPEEHACVCERESGAVGAAKGSTPSGGAGGGRGGPGRRRSKCSSEYGSRAQHGEGRSEHKEAAGAHGQRKRA